MRIDHKDSFKDFGNQFVVDSSSMVIGDLKNLKGMVGPFNLKNQKMFMDVGSGSGRILKNLILFNPKKFIPLNLQAIWVAKKI